MLADAVIVTLPLVPEGVSVVDDEFSSKYGPSVKSISVKVQEVCPVLASFSYSVIWMTYIHNVS